MPKILFASPHCLLDETSGAARCVRTQLRQLARRGWICRAVTGSVFDSDAPLNARAVLLTHGAQSVGAVGNHPLMGKIDDGVEHVLVPMSDTRRLNITAADEMRIFNVVEQSLDSLKPDILYMYGGLLLERSIQQASMKRDIPIVFQLANGSYADDAPMRDCALVLTPSTALADLYAERFGLLPQSMGGTFVDVSSVMAERPSPDRVTFITPGPEKGVTLFLELARQAQKRLPDVRFLVVEGRCSKERVADILQCDLAEWPNVEFIPKQREMVNVYARTKVLLVPSFWNEGFPRILVEAQANSIPVIASHQTAICEALAGGGTVLEVPERCITNFLEWPTEAEVQPWLEKLAELMTSRDLYEDAAIKAQEAAGKYGLEHLTDRLVSLLEGVLGNK
jgi:hypothetical protein